MMVLLPCFQTFEGLEKSSSSKNLKKVWRNTAILANVASVQRLNVTSFYTFLHSFSTLKFNGDCIYDYKSSLLNNAEYISYYN